MDKGDSNKRRLLRVTPGNLRNNHIYVREHYDFFPPDCVGPSRRKVRDNGNGHDIEIALAGLNETVTTDLGTSAKSGKPRGFLRDRKSVRRFLG